MPQLLSLAFLEFCENPLTPLQRSVYSWGAPPFFHHFFQRSIHISPAFISLTISFSVWVLPLNKSFYYRDSFLIPFHADCFGGIRRGSGDKHMFILPCLTRSPWDFAFPPFSNAVGFVEGKLLPSEETTILISHSALAPIPHTTQPGGVFLF